MRRRKCRDQWRRRLREPCCHWSTFEPAESEPKPNFRAKLARRWALLLARSPPQGEFGFDQAPETTDWPEMDQTAGQGGGWE